MSSSRTPQNGSPVPSCIRGILFDLDGTLRQNHPSSTHTFLDFAVRLGAEDSPEKRRQVARHMHYYWAQSPELLEDLHKFEGDEDGFWINCSTRHLKVFGCSAEFAQEAAPEIHHRMNKEYQPEDIVLPNVPPTLQSLKDAGFALGLLSNRHKSCDEDLKLLGLHSYFNFAMVAGEVDCWKPDPGIFHQAVKRLGTRPEETAYVGDNYFSDILGARRAGLHPVLIDAEGVFPDADCPVIRGMEELPGVLTNGLCAG